MKKKEIKALLKEHGYKMIVESWYAGKKSEKSAIFNAYNKRGTVYHFYVNWGASKPYALYEKLSNIQLHETKDASHIFF